AIKVAFELLCANQILVGLIFQLGCKPVSVQVTVDLAEIIAQCAIQCRMCVYGITIVNKQAQRLLAKSRNEKAPAADRIVLIFTVDSDGKTVRAQTKLVSGGKGIDMLIIQPLELDGNAHRVGVHG